MAFIHPPAQRFDAPAAPPLAAARQGQHIRPAEDLAAMRPLTANRNLLIETFGSLFSPLNDTELQIELVCRSFRNGGAGDVVRGRAVGRVIEARLLHARSNQVCPSSC